MTMNAQKTWKAFSVEGMYDGLALFLRLHPDKANTATDAIVVAQDASRDHLAVWREHQLQIGLGEVPGKVRRV